MVAKYLLFFRAVLLLTLGLQALYSPGAEKSLGWIAYFFGVYAFSAAVLFILETRKKLPPAWSPWTFLIDLAMATVALCMSPNHGANYYIAFFLVVLSSTILHKPAFSFLIAGAACLIYGSQVVTDYRDLMEADTLMDIALLMSTAFFSSFIVEQTRTVQQETKRQYESQLAWMQRLSTAGKALSSVLHEVKTPLGTIILNVEFVQSLLKEGKDVEAPLKMIGEESERAVEIIRDFIDFTLPAPLELKPLRLEEPLGHVLHTLQMLFQEKEIEVSDEGDCELVVLGSRRHLIQVFTNLLVNSVHAMPLGGRLTARIQRSGRRARVTLADNGVGISKEQLKNVFEPFESSRMGQGGAGLGLHIVRWIVEKHGGTVALESDGPGRGTMAILEFPIAESVETIPIS